MDLTQRPRPAIIASERSSHAGIPAPRRWAGFYREPARSVRSARRSTPLRRGRPLSPHPVAPSAHRPVSSARAPHRGGVRAPALRTAPPAAARAGRDADVRPLSRAREPRRPRRVHAQSARSRGRPCVALIKAHAPLLTSRTPPEPICPPWASAACRAPPASRRRRDDLPPSRRHHPLQRRSRRDGVSSHGRGVPRRSSVRRASGCTKLHPGARCNHVPTLRPCS